MQLTVFSLSLFAILTSPTVLARKQWQRTNVYSTFVQYFDNPSNSVNGIACGMTFHNNGWDTLGQIPGNKYLLGAPVIKHADDKNCGKCFKVSYHDKSLYATVVDASNDVNEWDLSTSALKYLGGNRAIQQGGLVVNVTSTSSGNCRSQQGSYSQPSSSNSNSKKPNYDSKTGSNYISTGSNSKATSSYSGSAQSGRATYDSRYDQQSGSLDGVACSNGENGLSDEYNHVFGNVPSFPYIGGFPGIKWNSPSCGVCYAVSWSNKVVYVTAVDYAYSGPNISKEAMDLLTDNQAEQLGSVEVTWEEVDSSSCSSQQGPYSNQGPW